MELDPYQIEDFPAHWDRTYVSVRGRLAYVNGINQESKTFTATVFTGTASERIEAPYKDLDLLELESGFYTIGNDLGGLYRMPARNVKRGINERNCVLSLYGYNSPDLIGANIGLTWDRLLNIYNEGRVAQKTKRKLVNNIKGVAEYTRGGFAINRNYGVVLGSVGGDNRPLICNTRGAVGYFINEDTIILSRHVSYIKDSLEESISTLTATGMKVNVR